MVFDFRTKLPVGHSDDEPIAFLHLGLAPNCAAGRFMKGDRIPTLQHPEWRERIELRAELGVCGARLPDHRPSPSLQSEAEGDQAVALAAYWQPTCISEFGGQCRQLALVAAQHGPRIQAYEALVKPSQPLAPSSEIGSLRVPELFVQPEQRSAHRGNDTARAIERAQQAFEPQPTTPDQVIERLVQSAFPRPHVPEQRFAFWHDDLRSIGWCRSSDVGD